MLEYLKYDENNVKTVCEMDGFHADMGMNIWVRILQPGQKLEFCSDTLETAVLLLAGRVKFRWGDRCEDCARENPFDLKPWTLHVSRNSAFSVEAVEESRVLIQQTDNDREWEPRFYTPENCLYQEFGKGQWGGAGHRVVSTMFDPDNEPDSNMVLGEVFTKAGKWSSYPPHHHPQPEVYYYEFDKPQGFGACYNGDDVYKTADGSACYIEPGKDHQQAAAPGYEMYYVWMIRHIDGDPWYKTTRFVSPEHEWLVNQ